MYLCSVNAKTRRQVSAVLLLACYVSILLFSSLHVHPTSLFAADECTECVNHLPHSGHISTVDIGHHECLLCQFLSITYIAAVIATVVFSTSYRKFRFTAPCANLLLAKRGIISLRAPPSLF